MGRLKSWILTTFYKNELLAIQKEYERKVKEINYEAQKKTKLIDTVHRVFCEPNHVIIGVETNKMGDEVLVVQWIHSNDIWIMLYNDKYKACNNHPRIMATYEKPYGEAEYIHIDDIMVEDKEIGNGSILMEYFLKYCKTTPAKYILGSLSSVDSDHFDRSEHYYQKHGFKVEFYEGRKSGSIRYSLDFYDVYEKTLTNYKNVEASGIDYIKRTLKKRISVYTNGQLDADDIFDTAKEKIDIYYKTLFYASAGIPRSLGYILKYSFLNSINKGNGITIADLNNASKKYFVNNILADFCNDSRYKESFFDESKILTQMTQKKLMDDLIEMAKTIKRGLIEKYTGKQSIKDIYKQTLEKYKSGITYWLPTSHFHIDKDIESILQTLELYYIVSKFNEGSSRKPGIRVSYYGLNYGLCLENQIDYGKPEFRRAYDYWRQDEFDYTDFIPAAINAVEVPKCSNCGYEYKDKAEYEVAKKFRFCLNCQEKNCIQEVNQLEEIMKEQIAKWRSESLPDIEIDILRVLYNNRQHEMSAVEIGNEVDRHHLAITKIMEKLSKRDYVSYVIRDKRYYSIKEKAISIFFNDVMETAENENS